MTGERWQRRRNAYRITSYNVCYTKLLRQWTGKESVVDANVYRYMARNNRGNPLDLALVVEGGRMMTGERTIRLRNNFV